MYRKRQDHSTYIGECTELSIDSAQERELDIRTTRYTYYNNEVSINWGGERYTLLYVHGPHVIYEYMYTTPYRSSAPVKVNQVSSHTSQVQSTSVVCELPFRCEDIKYLRSNRRQGDLLSCAFQQLNIVYHRLFWSVWCVDQ